MIRGEGVAKYRAGRKYLLKSLSKYLPLPRCVLGQSTWMLYIFGGLPGTGKSTVSAALARRRQAVYIRIDTIEQALRDAGLQQSGPHGYIVGYKVASENLRLGLDAVADSVNPIGVTREAWRNVAVGAGVPFVEIEVTCSDREEHRGRVESRRADVPGLRLPTWADVVGREYEAWNSERIALDTAGRTPEASVLELLDALELWGDRL